MVCPMCFAGAEGDAGEQHFSCCIRMHIGRWRSRQRGCDLQHNVLNGVISGGELAAKPQAAVVKVVVVSGMLLIRLCVRSVWPSPSHLALAASCGLPLMRCLLINIQRPL